MAQIKVIKHIATRQPIFVMRGSGLNANQQPKAPVAVSTVNPFTRAIKR